MTLDDLTRLKAEREADRQRHYKKIAASIIAWCEEIYGEHWRDLFHTVDVENALLAATAPPPDSVPVKVFVWNTIAGGVGVTMSKVVACTDGTVVVASWIDCLPVQKIPTTEATPCQS